MADQFEALPDGLMYRDPEPRPKRSRQCYDAFALSHIPGVKVLMDVSATTEQLSIFIPNDIVGKLPTLQRYKASTAKTHRKVGARSKSNASAASIETVTAAQLEAPRLPGSAWGLLAVLKLLLQKKVDINAVMLPHTYPPVGAEALAASKYLGCNAVTTKIQAWLKASMALVGTPHPSTDTVASIPVLQVLEALPIQEFSIHVDSSHQLVPCTASALALPAAIKTKWLRADCTKSLDLSTPGLGPASGWTDASWQSLVACLQSVPNLECLAVALPRVRDPFDVDSASIATSQANYPVNMSLPGYRCNRCFPHRLNSPTAGLEFVCQATCTTCGHPGSIVQNDTNCGPSFKALIRHGLCGTASSSQAVSNPAQSASPESLSALADASIALQNLKVLKIVDSPIRADCVGALGSALLGFARTLTELEMDTWNEQDTTKTPPQPYPYVARSKVLDVFSRLRNLERLRVRGWKVLAGVDCEGGAVLHELKKLARVEVGAYPCSACVDTECLHFDADLPFHAMPAVA